MIRRSVSIGLAAAALAAATVLPAQEAASADGSASETIRTPSGAQVKFTVPANWNGTVLLWSHGYSPRPAPAEDAPAQHRGALLAKGYALAGSSYSGAGWALAQAVPDQLEAAALFKARYPQTRRMIGWGMSMGGLVTSALAERPGTPINGALAMCSSIGGAVGMMNMALDGAYAFRTLVAPHGNIGLVAIPDDGPNRDRAKTATAEAMKTPQGRARLGLAAVLAGLPGWTIPGTAQPAEADVDAQVAQMAAAFPLGVFLPRDDQEQRAGGVFSWNTGVDYAALLARTGRRPFVEALYRKAGLNLAKDLAALNRAARVKADPAAAQYMTENYTPNARPLVPIVLVQNTGDGMTSPSLQEQYARSVRAQGRGALVESLWLHNAGHCNFSTAEVLASVDRIDGRLTTGKWPTGGPFVRAAIGPMTRPCVRGTKCR